MRAITIAAAVLLAGGITASSAQADDPAVTIYTASKLGKAKFEPYGEHLYITDLVSDGKSTVARLVVHGDTTYYYWNRTKAGSTRDVNMDLPEDRHVALVAYTGVWDGTVTGGIHWDSYDHMLEAVTTFS
ncbi:hypothetical protein OG230_16370 [Streptomyces sp. NBC_00234]|uniref:hypothetical protein n=1 Tax=Streptomyces sp. NBC_00234 TaxID=2903638 RepID=UPI002E2A4E47|nr:hypothetical protein [Streptomyces sp. NBC_00234]